MRILSTLNEVDPLFAIGERAATPRPANKPAEPVYPHDWTRCTVADLQHPEAPKSSSWKEPNGTWHHVHGPKRAVVIGVDPAKPDSDQTAVAIVAKPPLSADEILAHGGDPRIKPGAEYNVARRAYLNPTDKLYGAITSFRAAGWTDEQMVEHGYCEWVGASL